MAVFQFIAVFSCLLFTGAAVYVTLVEHPARLECGTEVAAMIFPPSYNRAWKMQVALALIATLSAVAIWYASGSPLWLAGALCIFFVVPYTFTVMMPTNHKLRRADLDPSAESTRRLFESWGRMHLARSLASLIASFIFLFAVVAA